MDRVARAILWWDEWQLRILVLSSLALQCILLLTAPMRKYSINFLLRRFIWLVYISSDAVAIYALAALFNRHAKASSSCVYGGKASSLEVLWAPILLVHLGGRDEITAFNIEDNELWTRHTITLVSQVAVAIYAFYKSWPGENDRRMLMAAIMLFVCGIINFIEKPLALRSATISQLVDMSSVLKGERKLSVWDFCFTEWWLRRNGLPKKDHAQMILADMSTLAAATKGGKQQAVDPGVEMTGWLRDAFELIYTRANVICSPAFVACNFLLVPALHVAAIVLFARSSKQEYNDVDIKMTYILMCATAVLDVLGLLISYLIYMSLACSRLTPLCLRLQGCNLRNSALKVKSMNCLTSCLVGCATSISWFCMVDKVDAKRSRKVAHFVIYKLFKSKLEGLDLASYRSLSAKKNWALGELADYVKRENLMKKVLCELPFDESVLVWHIATDLYFRAMAIDAQKFAHDSCTEAISNYMAYLLMFQPDMLMTGSRKHLFKQTMHDMEELLKGRAYPDTGDQKELAQWIIEEGKKNDELGGDSNEGKKCVYTFIKYACQLAEVLIGMDNAKKRRTLLYGVWTGMLCYSASMCRGYLHAKALAQGGEFLSFIWFVLSIKGAKTLADKLQMPQELEDDGTEHSGQVSRAVPVEGDAQEHSGHSDDGDIELTQIQV